MKSSSRRTTRRVLLAAGAAGLAHLGASSADAGLMLDVRAIGATGGTVLNPKSVVVAAPGSEITVGVFAQVTGTDSLNNETLNSCYGLLHSIGSVKGNLAGGVVASFGDSAAQNGSVTDWDGDGDLDIGVSPSGSSGTGKFFARNGTAGGYMGLTPVVTGPGASAETQIGQFVFTVTDLSGSDVSLNFVRRTNNGANVTVAALWFEDGSTISKNPTNSPCTVGTPVTTIIPEPATVGLLALGALTALRRRGPSPRL